VLITETKCETNLQILDMTLTRPQSQQEEVQ